MHEGGLKWDEINYLRLTRLVKSHESLLSASNAGIYISKYFMDIFIVNNSKIAVIKLFN